jgi:hypothetical protein
MRRSRSQSVPKSIAQETGSATLLTTYFALLLIGVSALIAIESVQMGARRAEVRKIEAVGLAAMDRAGGEGASACRIARAHLDIPCEFGGGEIALRPTWGAAHQVIRVGWRAH